MTARQDIEKLIACLGPEPVRDNCIPPTPWLLRQDRADRITRASVWPGGFARGREICFLCGAAAIARPRASLLS